MDKTTNTTITKAVGYVAITSAKTDEFNETVNAYLKKGYVLFGGMTNFEEQNTVYYNQVVIKLPTDTDSNGDTVIKD